MRSHFLCWISAAALLLASGCRALGGLGPAPQLPSEADLVKVDFENDSMAKPPEGFEAKAGNWNVVDSPNATSGTQVLVRDGDAAGTIVVKNAEAVRTAAGEVSVRLFVGSAGAGIACEGRDGGSGYALKVEPKGVALYKTSGDALTAVARADNPALKGAWARIGLRCDSSGATAYVDGKPKLRDRSALGAFDLALSSDAGVTAQFDDLAYWARK